jgi:hypothetical protein
MSAFYSKTLETFHGTFSAFKKIDLSEAEEIEGRQGIDQYGSAFYTAANIEKPEIAAEYAQNYTKNNGIVLKGQLIEGEYRLLSLDSFIDQNEIEVLRSQINNIAAPTSLKAYFENCLNSSSGSLTGHNFWASISSPDGYSNFIQKTNNVPEVKEITTELRSSRKVIFDGLDSDNDNTPEQISTIQDRLRVASETEGLLSKFWKDEFEKFQNNNQVYDLRSKTLGEALSTSATIRKNLIKDNINSHDIPSANRMDKIATDLLNKAGIDGFFIESEDTIVWKGNGINKIPDLSIIDVIGNGVKNSSNFLPDELAVGSVLVRNPLGAPSLPTQLNSQPSIAPELPQALNTRNAEINEGQMRGVGAALGVYGVVRQFQSGEFQNSIKAGGPEAVLASGNLAANLGAAAGDILETAHFTASKGSLGTNALSLSSQFNGAAKFVGRAAVPLALAAGALETGVAIQQRNPEKAAGAIGSTLGGLAAGAGTGALLGTMGAGPVGTVVGTVVGGVAGAIVGEKVVKATMTNTIAGMMGTAPPDGKETIGYRAGRTINHVGQTISNGIEKAIGSPVGRVAVASTALAISPSVAVAGTITNGIQELSRRHDIASDRRSVDRLSFDQLRNEIKNDRILPDRVNHNGRVMNIEDACRDPAYVTRTLGNLERIHMGGKQDVSRQVALFQELQERQKNSQAMAPNNIQRNSTVSSQALEEREIAIDRRQYDRMSLDQLRAEAKRDGTLPDRVTHNGRTMGMDEACRDPSYVQKTLRNLENLNNSGRADVSQEVALFREINERLNGQQVQTNIPTIARTANLSMG